MRPLTLRHVAEWLLANRVIPKKKKRRQALGTNLERIGTWLEAEWKRVQSLDIDHEYVSRFKRNEEHVKKLEASQQLYEQLIVHGRMLFPQAFQEMEERYGSLFAPYRALIGLLSQFSMPKAEHGVYGEIVSQEGDTSDATISCEDPAYAQMRLRVDRLLDEEARYGYVIDHAQALFPEVFEAMHKNHGVLEGSKRALLRLLNDLIIYKDQSQERKSMADEIHGDLHDNSPGSVVNTFWKGMSELENKHSHDNPASYRSVLTPRQDEA